MINKVSSLLLPVLLFVYWLYTGQFVHSLGLLGFYLFGFVFVKLFVKDKLASNNPIYIYNFFFFVYGLLALLTQAELIHDPFTDYYVHNDAALSFYSSIMEYGIPSTWNELPDKTLLNLMFADYPLAAMIFGGLAKFGITIGIIDLRLFLREHVFMLAAIIPALIMSISSYYRDNFVEIKQKVLYFGLFSYLFVTSCIFTRDLHVCLLYTLGAYVFLLPTCKFRLFYFVLLTLLVTGLRPLNGIVFIPYILFYYNSNSKSKTLRRILLLSCLFLAILVVSSNEVLNYGVDRLATYEEGAKSFSGGVFERIYSLPFPINQIGMCVYMLLMPLPFNKYIDCVGGSIFTTPFNLSPFLMAAMFSSLFYFLFKSNNKRSQIYQCLLCSLGVFFLITAGSPDLRRCFAAIPSMYMVYCISDFSVSQKYKKTSKIWLYSFIIIVNVFILVIIR